jgi:hypothetical protein
VRSVQLLCSPYFVNVLIHRNYFVTSVLNLPQSHRENPLPLYELYFGCKVRDQGNSWAPRSCCRICSRYLRGWLIGTHQLLHLAVSVACREQKDQLTDCYFCLTKIDGHYSKCKHTTTYPKILSALRPVKHDDSLPIPKPPQRWILHEELTSTSPEVNTNFPELTLPHLVSQSERDDLARDINISKIQAETLASCLQG